MIGPNKDEPYVNVAIKAPKHLKIKSMSGKPLWKWSSSKPGSVDEFKRLLPTIKKIVKEIDEALRK
jgi:hypothetical protein